MGHAEAGPGRREGTTHDDVPGFEILIVDEVLWHGSLNLPAHLRSTELMMRVVSVARR